MLPSLVAIDIVEMEILRFYPPPSPQKSNPLFLAKSPLNLQTVQAPFLGNPPFYISFLRTPLPLKVGPFSERPKY